MIQYVGSFAECVQNEAVKTPGCSKSNCNGIRIYQHVINIKKKKKNDIAYFLKDFFLFHVLFKSTS